MTQADWKDFIEELLIERYREELFNLSLRDLIALADEKGIKYLTCISI